MARLFFLQPVFFGSSTACCHRWATCAAHLAHGVAQVVDELARAELRLSLRARIPARRRCVCRVSVAHGQAAPRACVPRLAKHATDGECGVCERSTTDPGAAEWGKPPKDGAHRSWRNRIRRGRRDLGCRDVFRRDLAAASFLGRRAGGVFIRLSPFLSLNTRATVI